MSFGTQILMFFREVFVEAVVQLNLFLLCFSQENILIVFLQFSNIRSKG